jgi:hypothetical protein
MKKLNDYKYKIEGQTISVIKNGKPSYEITVNNGVGFCSCVGFGYRKSCRHYEDAQKNGMIDKIVISKKTEKLFRGDLMVEARKNSLIAMAKVYGWSKEKLAYILKGDITQNFYTLVFDPQAKIFPKEIS